MKRIITLFALSFTTLTLSLFAIPVVAHAQTKPSFEITTVRGQITGPDGNPFKLADVSVSCDGQTKTTKAGGQGRFIVVFVGRNTCEAGDTATITASKDGVTGSTTGIVQERRDGRIVDRNFSVVNMNVSVPEFGTITGAIALIGSAGTFFALRKRV